ncbi:hypothetical protein ACP4OV_000304 [Aristida adscensionis]
MGGAMKQLLGLLGGTNGGQKERRKKMVQMQPAQTVELRVRMDCERCEREVKKALSGIRGVQYVEVNRMLQKVTVTGCVDPREVLRRAQSTGKRAEPWPQTAPASAYYGHGPEAHHERWATASSYYPYPRSVEPAIAGAEQITNLFSDDNPNACSVM